MTRLYQLYKNRIRIISFIFFLCNILILSKMFFIQSVKASQYREKTFNAGLIERSKKGLRGQIDDRNGQILAETVNTYTFWVNTKKDFDKDRIAGIFADEFNHPVEHYLGLLSKHKNYIMLATGLLRTQCNTILQKINNIKGLQYDISVSRYYPYKNLVSQVVGYVDRDYIGQFGIERYFNHLLEGEKATILYSRSADGRLRKALVGNQPQIVNGVNIQLTVDIKFQTILLDALKKGLQKAGAITANGIIINPYSGDILAMASVPDFDPNEYWEYDPYTFQNRVISDSYEPGSTFKLISMTAVLESGFFQNDESFYCENGTYQIIPSKIIHDHEPHGDLSLSEIFVYSSNIGLAKLVDKMGAQYVYDYARKFGIGIHTDIPLPGESSGVLRKYEEWTRLSGPFVAMGQEISVNTLQIALAYSAAANGGYLPRPRLIKHIKGKGYENRNYSPRPIRQIMSNMTSDLLLQMMENVVTVGTASKAQIPGFRIGGKTGTAEKFIDGTYSKQKFISSFAAVFPINDPKFVCVISVDSPKYGYHWGNETAAPIVKEIFERIIIANQNILPANNKIIPHIANNDNMLNRQNKEKETEQSNNGQDVVPNFIGKTLKQTLQEAKYLGLAVYPVGTSGRVVWQSVRPGKKIQKDISCTIKLDSI